MSTDAAYTLKQALQDVADAKALGLTLREVRRMTPDDRAWYLALIGAEGKTHRVSWIPAGTVFHPHPPQWRCPNEPTPIFDQLTAEWAARRKPRRDAKGRYAA